MKIKAYLIDVINETHKAVEIENKLADYYRELQCTVIDIQERKIGKKVFRRSFQAARENQCHRQSRFAYVCRQSPGRKK